MCFCFTCTPLGLLRIFVVKLSIGDWTQGNNNTAAPGRQSFCGAVQRMRSAGQRSAVQSSNTQRSGSAAQRSAAQSSNTQRSTTQRSAVQNSTVQCNAAQGSTAQCAHSNLGDSRFL